MIPHNKEMRIRVKLFLRMPKNRANTKNVSQNIWSFSGKQMPVMIVINPTLKKTIIIPRKAQNPFKNCSARIYSIYAIMTNTIALKKKNSFGLDESCIKRFKSIYERGLNLPVCGR